MEPVEVHVLCGEEQAVLAAWMLASFHHYTGRNWRVVLHDDGSLSPATAAALRRLSAGITIVSRTEADAALGSILSLYSACADYRRRHPLAQKIFDVPALAQGTRIIILDTDVLFFTAPTAILAWLDDATADSCWFNEDVAESANLSPDEARTQFGCTLWSRVNSGLCLVPRAAIDLNLCERALRDTSITRGHVWRIEQTLFALCASLYGRGGMLPKVYEVSLGRWMSADTVARHYVGAVRQHFWGEGVWRLHPVLLDR